MRSFTTCDVCLVLLEKSYGRRPLWSSGTDGRIMLKCILQKQELEHMNLIEITHDRVKKHAFVNAELKPQFP
jgi:hypothetical protein